MGSAFDEHERDIFVTCWDGRRPRSRTSPLHERVSEQAVTDELTGSPTAAPSARRSSGRLPAPSASATSCRSLILDLDDFKQVNDTYGHLQGDEVLRTVGELLESESRAIDEPARYGGEEFVVALPETGSEGAVEVAERIRSRLEEEAVPAVEGRGKPLRVTASFGTATLPDAAADVRGLFEAADEALYKAKAQGKNRVVADGTGESRTHASVVFSA